jgi:hypothetical protein
MSFNDDGLGCLAITLIVIVFIFSGLIGTGVGWICLSFLQGLGIGLITSVIATIISSPVIMYFLILKD